MHEKTSGTAPKQGTLSLSGHHHQWSRGLWLCKAEGKRAGDPLVSIKPHCPDTRPAADAAPTAARAAVPGLAALPQGLQHRHWDISFSTPAPQLPAGSGLILVVPSIAFSVQNERCSSFHRKQFCGLKWATASLMGRGLCGIKGSHSHIIPQLQHFQQLLRWEQHQEQTPSAKGSRHARPHADVPRWFNVRSFTLTGDGCGSRLGDQPQSAHST